MKPYVSAVVRVRDVGVVITAELRTVLDNRHVAPEAPVRLRQFEAETPTAEDDEVLGEEVEP